MDTNRVKELLCEFFQKSGNNDIANQIQLMNIDQDSESSDLATLLNLANLAGGELLLQHRIKPNQSVDNNVENTNQSSIIQQNYQNSNKPEVQHDNIKTQQKKQIKHILLPAVLQKRGKFPQTAKIMLPECKIKGLLRSIYDSSLRFSGMSKGRYEALYQELSVAQFDQQTKNMVRPVVLTMTSPFYDYYSKINGTTRQLIHTQTLTEITHKDFEWFTGEYKALNQKFTEQMIQFFMLFKIKLIKLFQLKTLDQVKTSLKVFKNFMVEKDDILEIDLGKVMLSVQQLHPKQFDALCLELQIDLHEQHTEENESVKPASQPIFNTPNPDNMQTKKVENKQVQENQKEQLEDLKAKQHADPLVNILYQQIEKIYENKFWSESEKQQKIQPYLDQIDQINKINNITDDINISGSINTSSIGSINSDMSTPDDIDDDFDGNTSNLSSPDGPGFVPDSPKGSGSKEKKDDDESKQPEEEKEDVQVITQQAEQQQGNKEEKIEVQNISDKNDVQPTNGSIWTPMDLGSVSPAQKYDQSNDGKMTEIPIESTDNNQEKLQEENILSKLLPLPDVKTSSEWLVEIKIEEGKALVTQPKLPVTAYIDLNNLKRTQVREEILQDPRYKSLQSKMQLLKNKELLETLYDILEESNVNVQLPQHQEMLQRLPPVMKQISASQFPNELEMKVYFDGMKIGGSCMQQFVASLEDQDENEDEDDTDKILVPGEVIAGGRYKVQGCCGAATFSNCYHITDQNGRHLCLKVVKGQKEYTDSAFDEIRLLQYVKDAIGGSEDDNQPYDPSNHSHLIRIYDFFYYREHLMIIFPLLGEDLYIHFENRRQRNLPNDFSVDVIREISKQSLEALNALHSLNIYHLDVKPENVLVQKGFVGGLTPPNVTLIDLGSASFTCDRLQQYIQSRSYRAPEIMFGAPYDSRADVWSIGGVLAEALTGKVLFPNLKVPTMLARMAALLGPFPQRLSIGGRVSHRYLTLGQLPFIDGSVLKPQNGLLEQWLFGDELFNIGYKEALFADFIRQALTIDYEQRPTAAMLLQHPFLTE